MSGTKYTKNGKKVEILSTINSKQFMVKEYFIKENGMEILGGQAFVVEELFDEPVKTSGEVILESKIKNLENSVKNLENEYDNLKKRVQENKIKLEATAQLAKQIIVHKNNLESKLLNDIFDVMSLKYKWAVVDYGYYNNLTKLLPIDFLDLVTSKEIRYGNSTHDHMKTIRITAWDDKCLEDIYQDYDEFFILDDYERKVYLFEEYNDAMQKTIELITNTERSWSIKKLKELIMIREQHNITLPNGFVVQIASKILNEEQHCFVEKKKTLTNDFEKIFSQVKEIIDNN